MVNCARVDLKTTNLCGFLCEIFCCCCCCCCFNRVFCLISSGRLEAWRLAVSVIGVWSRYLSWTVAFSPASHARPDPFYDERKLRTVYNIRLREAISTINNSIYQHKKMLDVFQMFQIFSRNLGSNWLKQTTIFLFIWSSIKRECSRKMPENLRGAQPYGKGPYREIQPFSVPFLWLRSVCYCV